MTNYYKILGLKDFASSEEIKMAYRKLSKKLHPDVNDGDKFFEERFVEIQEAYEILSDTNQRNSYDNTLRRSSKINNTLEFENLQNTLHKNYVRKRSKKKGWLVKVIPSKTVRIIVIIFCLLFLILIYLIAEDERMMRQAQDYQPIQLTHFTIGSSKSDVIKVQGQPKEIYGYDEIEIWHYNGSTVTFINEKVIEFNNAGRNLKVDSSQRDK